MRSLEAIRDSLPAEAALVEYFSLKDQFVAAVVTRDGLKIVPLTPVSRVVKLLRMLHFQMSKFKLGAEYTQTFEKSMLGVVQAHLRELHEEIFAPVRGAVERAPSDHRAARDAALSSLSCACSTIAVT